MATDIDLRAISAFSSVPETTISSLLDSPSTDLVKTLLSGIESRVKEYEQSKSQKLKLEVELETVVRTSESKAKVLQNSRDKALAESSKLRVELQTSENVRTRLESELENFRSATANENSEVNTLKARVASLESANRDTLALLESKTVSYENISQDLAAQHQKAVEFRRQITTLEQNVQQANAAVASAKFKEQSLQQEVDLLKKNNEWLENERKIKAEEHSNFRKEKNARISELTRANEQSISEAEALRRSETSLKNRLEDHQSKFEDLLEDIQKLREEKTSSEDALRSEIEATQRLANLQQAAAETAKERVQELSTALEEIREEAADEIGAIRAESETEHADRVAAEERVAELEASLEQLKSEIEEARARPSTPQRAINGASFSTPLRASTPSGVFSPSTLSRPKAQMTVTQLFSEYQKLEGELQREKRANEQLRTNLDSIVEELENNKPEIEELRLDHDRLQSEVVEMSSIVDKANSDRESALKELRATQGRFEAKSKEAQVLAQQLRDLGSQLRHLMIEQHVREHGESLTREDFEELEAQANQALANDVADLSETQQVINQRLIVFRNITELQQQNENQLKTIRNLVSQLESNEAKEKEEQHHALLQEVEHLRQQVGTLKDELKSQIAQSNSFAKERDILRSMLTKRGLLKDGIQPVDFSRSLPVPRADSPAVLDSGDSDYSKLLKDLQQHFDTYRREASTDHTALKTQVDELTRKSSTLQADISRTVGQLTAANQRYEMLQANYNSLKTENGEIQKRSWTAMETAAKQELKTQQVAEELVEARGLVDSLRRDSANLKAEKDLWKSVERRLIEDNESLRNERSRLDSLTASLQSIINEREQADSETRRRLQSQAESLESELQSVKRKLNDELEENKKAALRREYEHDQSQKRIDDLVTSLSATKEELASAKTARDHLQARVDELTVELRSAEERLEVLTRRTEATNDANENEDTSLTREQELEVEVSELRRDLELKSSELERAHEQVEVYKSISQSSEERLQELGETNDQYREETETVLAEKESKIKDLEQRIEDISSELSTSNTELSRLRDEQGEVSRKLEEARAGLQSEIERLKTEAEKSFEQAQFNLEASKIQAQIATEAQQNYENELVKHAEAAKTLQIVRDEANQLRLQMVDLKTQAETFRTNFEQKEVSFDDMKDRYEREIADLRKRREEVSQQNNLLHSQLESVTQQITALQRDRAALADNQNTENNSPPTAELDRLQEVITYLRREKDIVDVQYQLSTQEAKRLRQQLDFAQSQLDETRLKLDQQRLVEADAERNAMSHNKLMDTLNELNLFRESSVTLRAEAKQASQALSEKSKHIEEVEGQLQNLQARVAELENLVELREGELKLAQDDRDHWQQRTQNILSKYDRVDPAELEALKERITGLENERDQAQKELQEAIAERDQAKNEFQAQAEETQNAIKSANAEQKTRLETQFKEVLRKRAANLSEVKGQLDAALAEKETLQNELDAVNEKLTESRAEVASISETQANGDHNKSSESVNNEASEAKTRVVELEAKVEELETSLAAKTQEIDELHASQEEKFKARIANNENLLNNRLRTFKVEAQQAKAAALEELATRLAAEHQKELEALKAQTTTGATVPDITTNESTTSNPQSHTQTEQTSETVDAPSSGERLTDETLNAAVTSTETALYLAKNNQYMKDLVTRNIKNRVTKETEALRQQLEAKSAIQTNGVEHAQSEDLEQKIASVKEEIIREEHEKYEAEKVVLEKHYEELLAQEKQSLIIQHQEELTMKKLYFDEESAKKIAEQVKNAEQLAEKKSQLKINMAQGQARAANAKLDVVKKAAEETPEKPVGEVWAIAKDAKPAPLAKPAGPTPTTASIPSGSTVPPTKVESSSVANTSTPATNSQAPTTTTPAPQAGPAEAATGLQVEEVKVADATSDKPSEPLDPESMKPPQASQQPQSGIPRGGAFRGGRGASGIPRGRGGLPRGGRGGQTGIPQQASRGNHVSGSPGRGNLNPNAAQFTPAGNKRAREDGESGDVGQGKRARGSSGGPS